MKRSIVIFSTSALILVAAACGEDGSSSSSGVPSSAPASLPAATTTATTATPDTTATPATTSTSAPGTTTNAVVTTTADDQLGQPAIWPAADVVFATPEEAATDFVTTVLRVPAMLGTFREADQRSGEIDVLSPGEQADGTGILRGTLVLRRLGADQGWFVIAGANDNAAITTPGALDTIPAGVQTVAGMARGFEASVVVTAFEAGNVANEFDRAVTMAGAQETPEPFDVTLDLSGALPGQTVVLLVQGGTGLETDPGDFGAIAVTIEA